MLYKNHCKTSLRNSCHVTIPYTYEQVRSECKCSGNCGAEGVVLLILVDCCEYSYSPGGASSYLGGNRWLYNIYLIQ